jgi:hypothetical protein
MPISARHGRSWLAACSTHSDRGAQRGQVRQRHRVDQHGAGAAAAQLDQVGALAVAVAGGALGVDRDRSGAGGEAGDRVGEPGGGGDRLGDALARLDQRDRDPGGRLVGRGVGRRRVSCAVG